MPPKTPEAILTAVQRLAAEGKVSAAPTTVAGALDPEIQTIFAEVWLALSGKAPLGGIWASDESMIGDVLEYEDGKPSPASLEALQVAGAKLGIALLPSDLFVDAAMSLRALQCGVETPGWD